MNSKTRIMLCVVLCFLMIVPNFVFADGFCAQDIGEHWGESQINHCIAEGIVTGYPDGTFQPDHSITRAEWVAIVNRSFGYIDKDRDAFKDVSASKWYYDEISKAKEAGYITGYSDGSFKPEKNVTREEAAVMLYRLLDLKEHASKDELKQFSDRSSISDWSEAPLAEIVKENYMSGYPNHMFKPKNNITRAEAITLIDRTVGLLIYESGTYGPEKNMETIKGNVTVNTDNVVLQNMKIKGDLYLAAGIGEGNVDVNNIIVEGRTFVNGGGDHSIVFNNTDLGEVVVLKINGKIRVVAKGDTSIEKIILESAAKVVEDDVNGKGIENIEVLGILKKGEKIQLEGDFDSVQVSVAVDVSITNKTRIKELTLDAAAKISGNGKVDKAIINAKNVVIEQKVDNVVLGRNIDSAKINKSTITKSTEKSTSTGGSHSSHNSNPVTTASKVVRNGTGGSDSTFDAATNTFGGTIDYYLANSSSQGNPPADGNYVGVTITAPNGVIVDQAKATFKYTNQAGAVTTLVNGTTPWLDGDNYVYYYPLVTADKKSFAVKIDWDGSGTAYAEEAITIKIADNAILVAAPTLASEIKEAKDYAYDPDYAYVGSTSYDEDAKTFTATYTAAQYDNVSAMNDMARYLGALQRQEDSTIVLITYLDTEYAWDNEGTLKGSNWKNKDVSLVSAIVGNIANYDDNTGIVITVSDGINEETMALKFVVTSTLDNVEVSKITAASLSGKAAVNQNAITITGSLADGYTAKASSALQSYDSNNAAQGSGNWVGFIVDTGLDNIIGLSVDTGSGNFYDLAVADVTEAASVGAEAGQFVFWMKADVDAERTLILKNGTEEKSFTINVVDYEASKVLSGIEVTARTTSTNGDKITLGDVNGSDKVYTIAIAQNGDLETVNSVPQGDGKWFGLQLAPTGITDITELQYKTTIQGTFADLSEADATESGVAGQLVWWIKGDESKKQDIYLKYKGETDDTALKLTIDYTATAASKVAQDPGKTGGEITFDAITNTFSGTIAYYEADESLGRTAGNRVGVQITAPEGVIVDKTNATFKYTNSTGIEKTLIGTWLDGENYVYYYPLVTADKKSYAVKIDWDGSGAVYAEETITIEIADGTTLVAAPASEVARADSTGGVGTDFDEATRTFSGTIDYYDADASVGRMTAGNRVGVRITAPAEVIVNSDAATFTYTNSTGEVTLINSEVHWMDGADYVLYYPLVTEAGQAFNVAIDWDGEGGYAAETITINIADGTILEAAPSTLKAEIKSAKDYVYDPSYAYVGTTSYDEDTRVFTATYTAEQYNNTDAAMNDMARYLGALYRQEGSTIVVVKYLDTEYAWNLEETLKGSNWENDNTSMVSAIVGNITSYDGDEGIVITVSDGTSEETMALKFVVTE